MLNKTCYKHRSDKIEEAQKKLSSPEEPRKELLDLGSRSSSDAVKGVKRKKIVTENHLKKIPKSPLRNVPKDKQRHGLAAFPTSNTNPSGSGCSKDKESLPSQNHKQNNKQSKGEDSSGCIVESVKSQVSMHAKKLPVPPDLCNGRSEVCDFGNKLILSVERSTSNSSESNQKSANTNCENQSKDSSCANSPFDVLLKAMEPELNTLNHSWPPCGTETEKRGLNKNPVSCTASKPSSFSQPGLNTRYLHHQFADHSGQKCTSAKGSQHVQIYSSSDQELHHSDKGLQKQQPIACPSFSSSLETTKPQHVYQVTKTTSIAQPSSSTVTQVLSLQGNCTTPINNSKLSGNSTYSLAQVASLISGEQMCNIVLKDQKPKKQGKYICEYCKRACAKPSVLLKHIRSHTGERPYPCVTCGFSFKTKSNLYKHKKSHAHAIKLGLGLRPDSGGMILSHDSDKALCIHSDVDESGESDDDYTSEERQEDQSLSSLECSETIKMSPDPEVMSQQEGKIVQLNSPVAMLQDSSLPEKTTEARQTELPKVVVYPVSVSPLRADSPKVLESMSEQCVAQMPELKIKNKNPNFLPMCSFSEMEQSSHNKSELVQIDDKHPSNLVISHAQLQRQQATDCSQEQAKCLLSPRSLGSTDSGYFSRSESADQAMSPPTPFLKFNPTSEKDFSKNVHSMSQAAAAAASVAHVQQVCVEKPTMISYTMRPPLGTKTLEERISKLISDNEAVVDNKQLDSVKPRRTSLSRRGSIDSPKSYIFKDSFQFDLKPVGRRTSSSSDIPKSPFTPTDKSKPVFFLSVPSQFPSIDCLPITRSNSMPTTGYSAIPTVIPTSHTLRGSQSFDDKIGTFYDDVFISAPSTPQQIAHHRTLVRQAAVEDSEHCGLGPARSVDESYPGKKISTDVNSSRSKSFVQGSSLDKVKKPHQGRGTMFECETCRNRYRKLENFENHKKFYCSELHGPKSKTVARETENNSLTNASQPQILHYRVASSTGNLEQPLQFRKRRKMKSVGDDDEPQQSDSHAASETADGIKSLGHAKNSSTITILGSQSCTVATHSPQIQLVPRSTDSSNEIKIHTVEKNTNFAAQEKVELKCQGTGISVIQHTNSLSRPSSFEKSESIERVSPVQSFELHKTSVSHALNTGGVIHEERSPHLSFSHSSPSRSIEIPSSEVYDTQRATPLERITLATQSRLVRQRNIQVPEILVTEEPDKDPDNQITDQELQEKFSWPQRSGSLSSLPTEKLPPKKKRIRLADLEHSSAESSFESSLSRSLSRESSLSRASSFSVSFDKEESSKSEGHTKGDIVNKSNEFLTIPTATNTFVVPREMRRAASEQINCTQPSMEVMEYRSKSFDCGSMSRSRSMSPTITITPVSHTCTTNSGHVSLLERRRGPLVKQISLNIGPESSIPVANSKFLNLQSENSVLQKSNLEAMNRSLTDAKMYHKETNKDKSITESHFKDQNAKAHSVQSIPFSDGCGAECATKPALVNRDLFTCVQNKPGRLDLDKNVSYNVNENACFAPKYQLQILKTNESQLCASKPVITILANSNLENSMRETHSSKPWNSTSIGIDNMTHCCTSQNNPGKFSGMLQNTQSFVVPVHNYSNSSYYCFSAASTLPEIIVTQDQGNQIVCKSSAVPVPISRDKSPMPKCFEEPTKLPSTHKTNVYKDCLPESVGRTICTTETETILQKAPIAGLLPQQETSASSKRMLSPANSLDIAMEKHQKRVKDESGAACNTSSQQVHVLSIKSAEPGKLRKPMLVRQVCTTDPSENLDQEVTITPGKNGTESCASATLLSDFLSSQKSVACVSEQKKEVVEYEKNKSLELAFSPVRNSSETSLVNNTMSVFSSQESRSPVSNKTLHIQGPVKLGAAISVVNVGGMHRLSFPSLKTSTSFTWCYLLKRKPMHLFQNDQKTSAYASWIVSPNNPNPMNLPTKVALSLLDSKQKSEKSIFTDVKASHARCDILVYSSKWKSNSKKLSHCKSSGNRLSEQTNSESSTDQEKDTLPIKNEPRRVKVFGGVYKSNEEYVYVRGRGRGKYICEECGIRCKKPSILKKHIRTHTDVRPYHCNYCNFSFKTKGNLTKHMKSKAHSKKCLDMGVAVSLIDEPDTDDSGERQRYAGDRSGLDADDSDGADEDDNDIEDEDEDSQTESILSATPSVTASPQHSRCSQQEVSSADEDPRMPPGFAQANSMDILPKALITRMTALSTSTICKPKSHEETSEEALLQMTDSSKSEAPYPKTLCHQMSVEYPENQEKSAERKVLTVSKDSVSAKQPSSPVDRSTQTMDSSADTADSEFHQQQPTGAASQPSQMAPPHTHLFSHLPLHSQQPVRSPYSMIPVGGIQLVPAGLTAYSTFLPFQTGPVQLTIPALGVIHRTTSTLADKVAEVPSNQSPIGLSEVNGVVPCIPIGHVNMPGLGASTFQPIQSLNMETLNILGLTNTNLAPQIHPSGITLNAVGLQVLTASPAPQNNPSPQAHIPGLQILNIALPTIIPSISPLTVEGQGVLDKSPSCSTTPGQSPANCPVIDTNNSPHSESPRASPRSQELRTSSSGTTVTEEKRTGCPKTDNKGLQWKQHSDASSGQKKTYSTPDHFLNVHSDGSRRSPMSQTLSPLAHQRRAMMVSRQNTVQFSDASSDEDEDRLIIAT